MTEPTDDEIVAWLSTDCIGERYLCFAKPKDSDQVRPLVFGDTTQQPTQLGPKTYTCQIKGGQHGAE